ncbi:MAG: hypothetical protein C4293_19580, partial [Nitrospiraceae bacterium]
MFSLRLLFSTPYASWAANCLAAAFFSFSFAAISAISGAFTAHSLAAGLDGVSFYWVYRESDVAGFSQVLLLTPPDRAVAGDAKVSYYGLYAGRGVDQGLVLRLL